MFSRTNGLALTYTVVKRQDYHGAEIKACISPFNKETKMKIGNSQKTKALCKEALNQIRRNVRRGMILSYFLNARKKVHLTFSLGASFVKWPWLSEIR